MDTAVQQPAPVPCQCEKQMGDALPWLAVALAIILLIDRFRGRLRRKKRRVKEQTGTADHGAEDGGIR